MEDEKRNAYFRQVDKEPFARLLNIRLDDVREGYARCEMIYAENMDNIYGNAHGGAIFGLIDEAFEISSNTHDRISVALNMNITYMKAPKKGSLLVAESNETHRTARTASYYITVKDGEHMIAVCQALVYRKSDPIPFLEKREE
mgnify:FL=1